MAAAYNFARDGELRVIPIRGVWRMISMSKGAFRALTYQTAGSSWEITYKPWLIYYYIRDHPRRNDIGTRIFEVGGWFR